jgi:hypothetical protein
MLKKAAFVYGESRMISRKGEMLLPDAFIQLFQNETLTVTNPIH